MPRKQFSSNNLKSAIINWCAARAAIPEDPDEVFCGGIDYKLDSNNQLVHLRVFVTTGRLLALMHQACKFIISQYFNIVL